MRAVTRTPKRIGLEPAELVMLATDTKCTGEGPAGHICAAKIRNELLARLHAINYGAWPDCVEALWGVGT